MKLCEVGVRIGYTVYNECDHNTQHILHLHHLRSDYPTNISDDKLIPPLRIKCACTVSNDAASACHFSIPPFQFIS